MDTGIGITLIGIGVANTAILVMLFVFAWQTSDSLRSDLRSEIRENSNELRGGDPRHQERSEGRDGKSSQRS